MTISFTNARRGCRLAVIAAVFLLAPWATGLQTGVLASPLGNLPEQFDAAVSAYSTSLDRFRETLLARAEDRSVCTDPEVFGLVLACMNRYGRVRTLHERMVNRMDDQSSNADRLELTQASQTYGELPPSYAAATALTIRGNCDRDRVVAELLQQMEAETARQQDRADFLGDLLSDALGDAEANNDAPETADGAAGVPPPTQGAWDQARFTQLLRTFDEAYEELRTSSRDFLDLLNQLAACCRDEICDNTALASSYASAAHYGSTVLSTYQAIAEVASRGTMSEREAARFAAGRSDPPDVSSLPIEDQLEFARVTARWKKSIEIGFLVDGELESQAPGCDSDDLADRGRRIGEQGQDPEAGVDGGAETGGGETGGLTADFVGSPTSGEAPLAVHFTDMSYGADIETYQWSFGDGGSSTGTNPSHTYQNDGNYTVSLTVGGPDGFDTETRAGYISVGTEVQRFVKLGTVNVQENSNGSCNGGSMSLTVTSPPVFPEDVRPDGMYSLSITVSWSTSGLRVADAGVGAGLVFLGAIRTSEGVNALQGSHTFSYTISGAEIDFGESAGAISLSVGGGLTCEGGTTDGVSAVFTQPYTRVGGN